MIRKTSLKFTLIVTIAFTCMAIVGCTRKKSEADDLRTLVVALSAPPATLDPTRATDATGGRIAGLLFSSIVRLGPDLKITGEAASAWSYRDLTWTFQLRPGLEFSNGRPVTAADIDYSFKKFLGDGSPFATALKSIKSVEVRYDADVRELKLHLSEYTANLLIELSPVKILPRDEFEQARSSDSQKLIGTGPFEFVKQDENEIRLRARTKHPYSTPKIENLVFKIIRDDNTRILKMLKGEIDIAQQELPPSRIGELESEKTFKVFKYPGLGMTYILVNFGDDRLKKLELRKAIAEAINREEIVQYKLANLAEPAASLLSPVSPFHDSSLKPPEFNAEHARKTIESLGLKGSKLILKTSSNPSAIENGKVLVNQLGAVGLDIALQSFEWGTFYGDVQKGNFQLATMRWVGVADPDLYRSAFHSREVPPVGRNRGGYKNAELDRWLEDGLKIESESARRVHYQRVQKKIFEDLAVIPLWYDKEVAVVHTRVKGYVPPVSGDFTPFTQVSKEGPEKEVPK